MTPKASNSNIYDPLPGSDSTVQDKETQTSRTSVNLMPTVQSKSIPCPKSVDTTPKDDNIKVFEFCQLVKDPQDDTVSIVKETFTEEVIISPEGSIFGKPTHNRYKYCREVIQPFCKAHTSACPKHPNHKEIPFKKSLPNRSSQQTSKNPSSDSCNTMCPDEMKTFENPSNSSIKKDKKKRPCPPTLPTNTKKECQKEATQCDTPSRCPEYKDLETSKDYLSTCLSTTISIAKKASASCLDKCEKTIGIRSPKCGLEKPTYYEMRKPKSEESVNDNRYGSILESDIVNNIKSGVKSIVDIVVSKTRATASKLTNSSSKDSVQDRGTKTKECENKSQIYVANMLPNVFKGKQTDGNDTKTSSLTDIKSELNTLKSQEDTEVCSKYSFMNLTSIFTNRFKSKEDSKSEDNSKTKLNNLLGDTFITESNTDSVQGVKDSNSLGNIIEPAVWAIKEVASAISSTASSAVSTVKQAADSTLSSVKGMSITDIINSRIDKSSPEDTPIIRTRKASPTNVANEQNNNASVFSMIKSKFYSIFVESSEKSEDESDNNEQETDEIFDKCYKCYEQ